MRSPRRISRVRKLKKGQRYTNEDGVSYELIEPGPGDKWLVRIESEFYSGLFFYPAQLLIEKFRI